MPQEQSKPPLEAKSSLGNIPAPTGSLSRTVVRELNQVDYHELRSEGDSLSYYEGQAREVVFGDKSPLRRLLAAATVSVEKGKIPVRRTVSYELPPEKYPMRRDLDAVASSVLDEFERAAKEFYDKVLDEKVNPYEKKLRLQFRLPDPEIEPEAYQVYGTNFERRLVVLWGVEKTHGSSLPLIHHKALGIADPKARTVAGELRKKLIGWSQKQADVQELLAQTHEPLWRFVVTKVRNPGTSKEGFAYPAVRQGTRPAAASAPATLSAAAVIPADTTRPLTRLFPREMKQFYKACQDFYSRAEATECSPYERELRREFLLPDPAQSSASYRVHGSRFAPRLLVIAEGPDALAKDKWTWLTPFKSLDIPPAPLATAEHEALGQRPQAAHTVTEALARKTYSYARIAGSIGGVAALLAGLGIAAILWRQEKKAPEISSLKATDEHTIQVDFTKTLRSDSLIISNFLVSLAPPTGETAKDRLPIISVTVNSGEAKKLTVTLGTNMVDGVDYDLQANRIQSTATLALPPKSLSKKFTFSDSEPPKFEPLPSAGDDNRSVRVAFSKRMDPEGILTRDAYQIGNETPENVSAEPGDRAVILFFPTPLVFERAYTLRVRREKLTDTATRRNQITTNNVEFRFVDLTPPILRAVKAKDVQNEPNRVFLTFHEELDAESATNPTNYAIFRRVGAELKELKTHEARFARAGTNINPKEIELIADGFVGGIDYEIHIKGIGDCATARNFITNKVIKPFKYEGANRSGGPTLAQPQYSPGSPTIEVVFEPATRLRSDTPLDKTLFAVRLIDTKTGKIDMSEANNLVESIAKFNPGGQPKGIMSVTLNLKESLASARAYRAFNLGPLTDVWGNTNQPSMSPPVQVPGESEEFQIYFRQMTGPKTVELFTSHTVDLTEFAGPNGKEAIARKFDTGGSWKVVSVARGDNDDLILLQMDKPLTKDNFAGICEGLRVQGWPAGIRTSKVNLRTGKRP